MSIDQAELYRLTVEMADRVSARRATANTYFLSLHTVLAGVAGLSKPIVDLVTKGGGRVDQFGVAFICVLGVVLCAAWFLMLKSYRDLNRAKFRVIGDLETTMPIKPFTDEWKTLKGDPILPWRKRYAELGLLEQAVPAVFAIAYVVAAGRVLVT